MRIGLDLHGIITVHPSFFSELSKLFVGAGHEVHILTGSHIQEKNIIEELKKYGIEYTHIFSIADHHRDNQTDGMWYDDNGDPWVSNEDWDKTKADYCKKHNIDFCIDDTARYANYFETPFGYMAIQLHKDKPNKYLNMIITFFNKRALQKKYKSVIDFLNKQVGWLLSPADKQGKEYKNRDYK